MKYMQGDDDILMKYGKIKQPYLDQIIEKVIISIF
jgi:hypothetical protein